MTSIYITHKNNVDMQRKMETNFYVTFFYSQLKHFFGINNHDNDKTHSLNYLSLYPHYSTAEKDGI